MVRTASLSSFACLVLFGCASAEPAPLHAEYDPALEDAERQKLAADADRRDFQRVLLQLDQAMDSYVRMVANSGVATSDVERERLERLLRQLVSGEPAGSNTDKLIALASDGSDPHFQGIALAALGFADRRDVMPVILQGAQLADPNLQDRAVLGLAILHDARTPPGVVAAVMNDRKHNEGGRVGASWALLQLQEGGVPAAAMAPIWLDVLQGDEDHPLLLANAVRGLGFTRDAKYADVVASFVRHPTPRVRLSAAIALGRMNAQARVDDLLTLLQPSESVPNVRLAARKALQTLAGGIDRGYDVELWRLEFDRGRTGQR